MKEEYDFELLFRKLYPDKWTGKDHQFCPFHNDQKNPNLTIKGNSAYCWACQKSFGIQDLLYLFAGKNTGGSSKPLPKGKIDFEVLFEVVKSNELTESVSKLLQERKILDTVKGLIEKGKIGFHDNKLYIPLYRDTKIVGLQKIKLAATKDKRYKFEAGTKMKGATFKLNENGLPLVAVESFIDACSVIEAYPECCVINMFSAHGNKLTDIESENLVLFLDNDDAGRRETKKALKILNYNTKVVDWEGIEVAKDVNDLLKSGRSDVIRDMIDNAKIIPPPDENEDEPDGIDQIVNELNEKYAWSSFREKPRTLS